MFTSVEEIQLLYCITLSGTIESNPFELLRQYELQSHSAEREG
jgi:hypothetical protein